MMGFLLWFVSVADQHDDSIMQVWEHKEEAVAHATDDECDFCFQVTLPPFSLLYISLYGRMIMMRKGPNGHTTGL